ncbi:MAG: hypothetical protein ACE5J3_14740 [Methanosarcinales archaeon]
MRKVKDIGAYVVVCPRSNLILMFLSQSIKQKKVKRYLNIEDVKVVVQDLANGASRCSRA